MVPRLHRLLGFLLLLLLAACSASAPPRADAPASPTPLLLISFDGVRADALGRGDTPNLDRLASGGVRAQWMRPSYPSLTFPNHYTLVTGLRPDRHGIIHNTMWDPELGEFRLNLREAVGDGRWWGGEPAWVGAHKAGLRTATMFWPGAEAEIAGVRPDRWRVFDQSMPSLARAEQVLAWLSEPPATRPHLVTLYFDITDTAAHYYGPHSEQARQALREADAAFGHLLQGLEEQGLLGRINIIVVSDHGMAEVPAAQVMAVEDIVDPARAKVVSVGQVLGIAPLPGHEAEVEQRLLGAHPQYDCWRRTELPARWRFGRHPRVPPIVCQMHEGWDALPREYVARRAAEPVRGSHGYDPALPSMGALFIAAGPAFRQGEVLPPFDNVDVYPLLAHLLGFVPADNDGNLENLRPALQAP